MSDKPEHAVTPIRLSSLKDPDSFPADAVTPLTIDDVNAATLKQFGVDNARAIHKAHPIPSLSDPETIKRLVQSRLDEPRENSPITGIGGLDGQKPSLENVLWTAAQVEACREPAPSPRAPIFWEKQIRKVVVTLNINNYEPAIRELTYPLMHAYAQKIGADFCEITERKYPDWPIVMEKEQCADICRDAGADWVIYFDADALISREMFDVTDHLTKPEVCFNGKDMSGIRSRPDKYFRRDGRWIGACSWFMVASDWTADSLWRIPDDLTFEECLPNMFTTIQEHNGGQFKDNHLIDDYIHSRNIAQFGLKHRQLIDICGGLGWRDQFGRGANPFMFHLYSIPYEQKVQAMLTKLSTPQEQMVDIGAGRGSGGPGWCMMSAEDVRAFKKKWGLK